MGRPCSPRPWASSRSPAERALESGAAAAAAVGAALFAANEARTSAPGTQRDTPLGTRSGLCRDSHAGLSARPVLVQVTQPLRLPLASSALRQALF